MTADSFDETMAAEELPEALRPVEDQRPASAPVPPRMTVAETVYYHAGGEADPVSTVSSFERVLTSGEQLYVRETATKDGRLAPLDTGWLGENVAQVVIENLERRGTDRPLSVHFGTGREGPDTILGLVVPAGESVRFAPFRVGRVHLGSARPGLKYRVTAVPW